MHILLTELFRPHLGYVGALHEAYNINILITTRVQENYLGLIFGVPGSEMHCASFSFRLECWLYEDLVAGRTHQFIIFD